MRITKLELENFKRFTKLTIDMTQFSNPPKLVLLIGANGSGKSSVFDGFEALNSLIKIYSTGTTQKHPPEAEYYRKNISKEFFIKISDAQNKIYQRKEYDLFESNPNDQNSKELRNIKNIPSGNNTKLFYGRTSLRQIPRLTRFSAKNGFNIENDTDRPLAWIDRDERFENDLEQIYRDLLNILFDVTKERTNLEVVEEFIQPISNAFGRIFGENGNTSIRLTSIVPPGDGKYAEVLFIKGNSTIHYNLLSSGEKEVFNILLNLSVRGKYYQDTIYFIDEMDLHLEYSTQKAFLKEITERWIPDTCQLWTASHSLGFIQYANENKDAAIIDFDNLDFDQEQVIYPSEKNTNEVFEIAVSKEFLGSVFSGKNLVFCENNDADLYNRLNIINTIFVRAKHKADVFHKAKALELLGLADRDYLADSEIATLKLEYPFLRILTYYSIENYLYHPDNLAEHFSTNRISFNREKYISNIIKAAQDDKAEIVYGIQQARSGYPFFKENEQEKQLKLFKEQGVEILKILESSDFETFYKVFPMKDYGKTIPERQNLNKKELANTQWFKQQIEKVLQK